MITLNKIFVLDCSITMTWCFTDDATAYSRKALRLLELSEAVVPYLWVTEVGNVLRMAEKKGRISLAQSSKNEQMIRAGRAPT